MKILAEDLELGAMRLKRYLFTPDDPGDIRAAAFHLHGQGDYSARYDETMEVFTRQGIACVATDLPGHGRSEGKRGRVPGFEVVDRIVDSNQQRCRQLCPEDGGPLGILGHSAGGLMVMRELLRRPEPYSFSWISSPLVRPEANKSRFLVGISALLARLLPDLTVTTGVSMDDCVHPDSEWEPGSEEPELLFHARISIRWGYEMMMEARKVRSRFVSHPPSLPLLITQGTADKVCPPQYLREVISGVSDPAIRYQEFPEALHEPFADTRKADVFTAIEGWLQETLGPAAALQTSPSG